MKEIRKTTQFKKDFKRIKNDNKKGQRIPNCMAKDVKDKYGRKEII